MSRLKELYESIFNDIISENSIDIELIDDLFLKIFDFINYYPESKKVIYFYKENVGNWIYRLDFDDIYDLSKSEESSGLKDIRRVLLNEKLEVNFYILYDIYSNNSSFDDRVSKINKIENGLIDSLPVGYKYISVKDMNLIDAGKRTCIGVLKEFTYNPKIDLSYLNDIPKNIIKDFHEFIVLKRLSDNDIDKLKNMIKRVSNF